MSNRGGRVHVRYAGTCPNCGTHTQATPTLRPPKPGEAWIRCSDCDHISVYEQDATEAAGNPHNDSNEY